MFQNNFEINFSYDYSCNSLNCFFYVLSSLYSDEFSVKTLYRSICACRRCWRSQYLFFIRKKFSSARHNWFRDYQIVYKIYFRFWSLFGFDIFGGRLFSSYDSWDLISLSIYVPSSHAFNLDEDSDIRSYH